MNENSLMCYSGLTWFADGDVHEGGVASSTGWLAVGMFIQFLSLNHVCCPLMSACSGILELGACDTNVRSLRDGGLPSSREHRHKGALANYVSFAKHLLAT